MYTNQIKNRYLFVELINNAIETALCLQFKTKVTIIGWHVVCTYGTVDK